MDKKLYFLFWHEVPFIFIEQTLGLCSICSTCWGYNSCLYHCFCVKETAFPLFHHRNIHLKPKWKNLRNDVDYEAKRVLCFFWKVCFIISDKFTFPVVLSVVEQLLRSGNKRGIVSLDSEAHFLTFFSFRVELNTKLFSDKQKKISVLLFFGSYYLYHTF